MHWSAGSALKMDGGPPGFLDDLYLSGTTFFTLGMGDVVPRVAVAKLITVGEAGLGFAFLAIMIGYLPVIYQAFSRREIAISMLDPAPARRPPPANCSGGTGATAARTTSPVSSPNGNAGRRKCSRATSPIRCSPTSARSTATSRGLPRSPPSSIPAPW